MPVATARRGAGGGDLLPYVAARHSALARSRPLVLLLLALLLLAGSAISCGNELPATFVEAVYGDACKFVECPPTATCAVDAAGGGRCFCYVGYVGAACERCEPGFHRDAFDRCVSDESCSELREDPCGSHGVCVDESGVIECSCDAHYAGPRCQLCGRGYVRDAASVCLAAESPAENACEPDSCPEHATCTVRAGAPQCACHPGYTGARCEPCPSDTLVESFDQASDWPSPPNTCTARPELSLTGLVLRSRQEDGTVQLCAPSTFHELTTPHIELEAGPTRLAELHFAVPTELVSFRYATRLQDLSLDVLADGLPVGTIELPPKSASSLTLQLDPPATTVALRSRTLYLQHVALDDLTYHAPSCN